MPDSDETPEDPYKLLESTFSQELLGGSPEVRYYQRFESISNGAGATMAYTRAQSGTMNASIRDAIKASLKQYCELDTLAMVMIMQAWRAEAGI